MGRTLKLLAGLCVLIGAGLWLVQRPGLLHRFSPLGGSKTKPVARLTPTVPKAEAPGAPVTSPTVDPAQPPPSLSDRYPQQTGDALVGPDIDHSDLAAAVETELAQIRPGVSVADWRKDHPADTWHRRTYDGVPREDYFGDYCAVFKTTRRFTDGSKITRRAAFFIPVVPESWALPDDSTAASLIENGCVLGGIQVELTIGNKETLLLASDQVVAAISAQFGPAAQKPDPMEPEGLPKRNIVTAWMKGEATVRLRPTAPKGRPDPEGPHPDLTVTSYLPNFHYELREVDLNYPNAESYETNPQIFELAMRTAAMDEKTSRPMQDLFHTCLDLGPFDVLRPRAFSVTPEKLAGILQQWVPASMNLTPRRRAAALLAADAVLDSCWYPIEYRTQDLGDQAAKPLEAIGIKFFYGGPDGTTTDVTWLNDAYKLDPSGPIGDTLTYMSLVGDWPTLTPIETEGVNGLNGLDNYNTYLIDTGTKYLSRPRDLDTIAKVEYVIASAYCDRVAIAEGIGDAIEGQPGPPTQPEFDLAHGAREESLKHYRTVLAIDKTSKRSLDAWRSAWKLMAGLPLRSHNAHGDP